MKRPASWIPAAAVLCGLFLLFAAELTEGLPQGESFVPGEILVRLKPGARIDPILSSSPVALSVLEADGTARMGIARLKIRSGTTVQAAISALTGQEGVLFAQPNYIYHTALVPNDPSYASQWGPGKIGAPAAWDLTVGSADVLVAVLDTGIDTSHPDLAGNLWTNPGEIPGNGLDDDGNGFVDDVHGVNSAASPSLAQDIQDNVGHGTHVSGIIGAVGNNGVGVSGLNWHIGIITVKANEGSSFYTSDLVEGIDYVTALRTGKNLPVVAINASLGGPVSEDAFLNEAIGDAGAAGILFVAAAGNNDADNDLTPFYPAGLFRPNVLSVAATDENDSLAVFNSNEASNYGRRTVHLGAPGKNILSTYWGSLPGSDYSTLSGTSMAAPHVTGVLALMKAQDPDRDWIALKNRLLSTGTPLSGLASKTITGRRLLAGGDGTFGALTGSGQPVRSRLRSIANSLDLEQGASLDLAALNISGEESLGDLSVSITQNGASYGTVTLRDNGTGFDQAAGDGIASATWSVPSLADCTYVFAFPDGNLTVTVDLAEEPPAPSGGGGGGGCSGAALPAFALFLLVPLAAGCRKKSRL
ncbi:MAG: S8 family peptidase [Synergistales bacterium]